MPYYGYYGFGYDPLYLIIVLVTTVVGLMAQSYINSTYRRWSRVPSDGETGEQVARPTSRMACRCFVWQRGSNSALGCL